MAETTVLKAVDFSYKSQVIEREKIFFEIQEVDFSTKGQIVGDPE